MTSPHSGLQLPPPFTLIGLREAGDAFEHACSVAAEAGAGTLVWARRFHLAEFAIVLEPDEDLAAARRVIYAGANALADALAGFAPPQHRITFDWPDAVRVDGALVGGLRLGWPETGREDEVPDWLVLGCVVRTVVMRAGEPGLRPLLGGLDEQGFDDVDPAAIVEAFSRCFLREMNGWNDDGFEAARQRWMNNAPDAGFRPQDARDLLSLDGRSLKEALASPAWLDPATGAPWL
jgi:biotin-(acetyl-CoA carboxylase) ligase